MQSQVNLESRIQAAENSHCIIHVTTFKRVQQMNLELILLTKSQRNITARRILPLMAYHQKGDKYDDNITGLASRFPLPPQCVFYPLAITTTLLNIPCISWTAKLNSDLHRLCSNTSQCLLKALSGSPSLCCKHASQTKVLSQAKCP